MIRHLLALDTATETTVVALASWIEGRPRVLDAEEIEAPRAAMSKVFVIASELLARNQVPVTELAEVVVGRGPGSFTGVRIGVTAAKGIAHGLDVPLYGVGTLDSIAWRVAMAAGASIESERGMLIGVVGDAMRGEVYPALFRVTPRASGAAEVVAANEGYSRAAMAVASVERLGPDIVERPASAAERWAELGEPVLLAGNGLRKHAEVFGSAMGEAACFAPMELWSPSGVGMIAAYGAAARADESGRGIGDVGAMLPIYTRLSDAEEAEHSRLGAADSRPDAPDPKPKAPANGVAGPHRRPDGDTSRPGGEHS